MFRDCKLWGPQLVVVLHENSSFANVLLFLRKYLLLFWNWFCEIFLVGFFWASCTILRLYVWRFLWWHFTLWNWTALILELFRTMVCVVNLISEVFFFTIWHLELGEKVLSPLYVSGSSQFPPLSLKPTNFPLYVWKMSKYPQSVTFSVKFS